MTNETPSLSVGEERARKMLAREFAKDNFMAFAGRKGGFIGRRDEASVRAMLAFASEHPASAKVEDGPAIPEGMKPWHGGDSAPEDWDGGPVYRGAMDATYVTTADSWCWRADAGGQAITAYTPKPQPTAHIGGVAADAAVIDAGLSEERALAIWKAEAERSKLLIATQRGRANWPATEAVLRAMRQAVAEALSTERERAVVPSEEVAAWQDELDRIIIAAYEQGALDVHNNWQEDADPSFSEAARDYASSVRPPQFLRFAQQSDRIEGDEYANWIRIPKPTLDDLSAIGEAAEGAFLSEMGWAEIGRVVWDLITVGAEVTDWSSAIRGKFHSPVKKAALSTEREMTSRRAE
jgi:hypothetical protein